mmetsp:Transcript_1403/g.4540  ORF Transcript_1403/g.4540 Transcript_1403/m.4540 type:complete len:214 (-) Transcript_1403:54-695(-)
MAEETFQCDHRSRKENLGKQKSPLQTPRMFRRTDLAEHARGRGRLAAAAQQCEHDSGAHDASDGRNQHGLHKRSAPRLGAGLGGPLEECGHRDVVEHGCKVHRGAPLLNDLLELRNQLGLDHHRANGLDLVGRLCTAGPVQGGHDLAQGLLAGGRAHRRRAVLLGDEELAQDARLETLHVRLRADHRREEKHKRRECCHGACLGGVQVSLEGT